MSWTRFLGYENESCRLWETNSLLWNQQACPWIWAFNMHFPTIPLRYISGHSDKNEVLPCGGGVEYLHRNPASRRRRRKGKSRIWDSKIWSRVPRVSDPKMTTLERTSSNCKRQTRPLVSHSKRKTRREDSCSPVRMERVLGSRLLWVIVIDCKKKC
jgi:hypothetical protein